MSCGLMRHIFVTQSQHIYFITAQLMNEETDKTLLTCVTAVKKIYKLRGFKVRYALMDGEFESLQNDLTNKQISLNICSHEEHFG